MTLPFLDLLQAALPWLLGLAGAVFGARWLRRDAARDARKDLVKEIDDADKTRAREIRADVAAARRTGGLRPGDDPRGFRD